MSARDQLLFDLFTTALEGGIGYWSTCEKYHHSIQEPFSSITGPTPETRTVDDLHGFYAEIIETGDGDDYVPHRIDHTVLNRGYGLACEVVRDVIRWSSGEKPPLVITDDTDWDFDASDADVIVQLGLFGEVVYG